jgi:hypothetical protein
MVANKGLRLRTEVLQFATKNGYTCVRRLRRLAVKLLPTVAVRRTRTPAPRLRCFGASFRSGLGSGRFYGWADWPPVRAARTLPDGLHVPIP